MKFVRLVIKKTEGNRRTRPGKAFFLSVIFCRYWSAFTFEETENTPLLKHIKLCPIACPREMTTPPPPHSLSQLWSSQFCPWIINLRGKRGSETTWWFCRKLPTKLKNGIHPPPPKKKPGTNMAKMIFLGFQQNSKFQKTSKIFKPSTAKKFCARHLTALMVENSPQHFTSCTNYLFGFSTLTMKLCWPLAYFLLL